MLKNLFLSTEQNFKKPSLSTEKNFKKLFLSTEAYIILRKYFFKLENVDIFRGRVI